MKNRYAFFDVDSLEIGPTGRTYVCHPRVEPNQKQLFELYGVISGVTAPLIFSVDVNGNVPDDGKNQRQDFLSIPVSLQEKEWKNAVADRFKFYVKREPKVNREDNAIFINNKNVPGCVEIIDSEEWIVFGNGMEHSVDHVIENLLKLGAIVKFIPELIIPGEGETEEQFDAYYDKWVEQGAIPFYYKSVIALAGDRNLQKL